MDAKEIWLGILEQLRTTMTGVSYSTWILELTPIAFDNGVLVLLAPNNVICATVENVYKSTIARAAQYTCQNEVEVRVVTNEGEAARIMQDSRATNTDYRSSAAPMLNSKYTFDTFVVGESNKFAHAAALAVAEKPGTTYNPLFIHGGVGLGKTHLMHAIGHVIYERNPNAKILYITSETFTNELIQAIHDGKNMEFRSKYRNLDVLMVDDVQFIAGKESTQSEFFHTFNTLYLAGKQIVITSDMAPREISTLDERMRTRFECGLVADIQQPDYETRAAILRKKVDNDGITISDDLIYYIAERVQSNIRELEGALTRVIAHAQLTGAKITTTLIDNVIADMIQLGGDRKITSEIVLQAVAEYFNITVADLMGKKRDKQMAFARQIAMYLCRKLTGLSYEEIGSAFGGKHYTTVMHNCNKINDDVATDKSVSTAVEDIELRLTAKA